MNVFDILREELKKVSFEPMGEVHEVIYFDDAMNIINEVEQQHNNGWIPADQPPKHSKPVLLSFENFTTPLVGRYEEDENGNGAYYIGDEDETLVSQGIFVNAWQPLKERYQEGE